VSTVKSVSLLSCKSIRFFIKKAIKIIYIN
jgi:hypothetical protein